MESAWQRCRLLVEDRYWTAVGDGSRENLGVREVQERFGLEAFRRRAAVEAGDPRGAEPLRAALVGRQIMSELDAAGWEILEDGPHAATAEHAGERWSIRPRGDELLVAVSRPGAPVLERVVRDLGGLERTLRRALSSRPEALAALAALAEGPRRWDPIRHAGELDPETFFALYDPEERAARDPSTGGTALTAALRHEDEASGCEIAARLLDDGIEATTVLPDGSGVLHLLLARREPLTERHAALVSRAVERGAAVNLAHPVVGTPLQVLARRPSPPGEDRASAAAALFERPELDLLSPGAEGQSTLGTLRRCRHLRPELVDLAEDHLRRWGPEVPDEVGIHGGVAPRGVPAGTTGAQGRIEVLESIWQWARLSSAGGRWTAVVDRHAETLDDQEVRRRFGAEPFRRREELARAGRTSHDPLVAPLIAVAVAEHLTRSGWHLDVLTERRAVITRGAERVEASIDGAELLVEVSGHEGAPDDSARTSDLGALEEALGLLADAGTGAARRRLGMYPPSGPPSPSAPGTSPHPPSAGGTVEHLVMDSAWQWSRLWWAHDAWHAIEGGVPVTLDDEAVARRFGAEAVRRRDALIAQGAAAHDPVAAPLIAPSVIEALCGCGWEVGTSTPLLAVLTRGEEHWRIGVLGPRLSVTASRRGKVPVRGLVEDLGALERAIGALAAHPEEAYSAVEGLLVLKKTAPDLAAKKLSAAEYFAQYDDEDLRYISPSTSDNVLFGALGNPDAPARAAIAHRVLDLGMDPTISLGSGVNALHVVLGRRGRPTAEDVDLVRRLLDAGTDPNQRAVEVGTPLELLADQITTPEDQLLPLYQAFFSREGLDLLTPGAYGQSALGLARKSREHLPLLVQRMEQYLRDRGKEVPLEGGMHGGIHREEPLTRKDVLEIIEGEGLSSVVFFTDPTNRMNADVIGEDEDGWFTVTTDERAGVWGTPARFDTEAEALADLIARARWSKQSSRKRAESAARTRAGAGPRPAPSAPDVVEQGRLIREIAEQIGSAAPGAWTSVRFVTWMTAPVSGSVMWVQTENGEEETRHLPPRAADRAAKALRSVMYVPGKGTWFTMTMVVRRDGTADTAFDHDHRPEFDGPPIDPIAFVTDLRRFPRSSEHIPAWLQEILDAQSPSER